MFFKALLIPTVSKTRTRHRKLVQNFETHTPIVFFHTNNHLNPKQNKPMWKPQQLRWTSLQSKQTLQKRSPLHQACNQQRKHDFKPLASLNLKSCNPFKCGTFTGNHGEPGSVEEWNLHAELGLLRARMKHARKKPCCVCAHITCYVKHETCYVQAHDMSMPAHALFVYGKTRGYTKSSSGQKDALFVEL